jgi:hypothetical protein
MNNYDVPCGGIIYPGPQLKVSVDVRNKQVIAWIPFTWTEKAFEVAPNYFAFISDRMAAIHSRIGEEDLDKFVEEVERTAFEFYEAIAVPGAVAPEMPEFLYNEEVEINLEDVMEMEEDQEEVDLESIVEEESKIKKDKLLDDIEEGNLEEATDQAGGYSISKDIAEDEEESEDEPETSEDVNEFPESVFEETSEAPEPPSVSDAMVSDSNDKPPEKKISLSIEKLRKMVDEQDK